LGKEMRRDGASMGEVAERTNAVIDGEGWLVSAAFLHKHKD